MPRHLPYYLCILTLGLGGYLGWPKSTPPDAAPSTAPANKPVTPAPFQPPATAQTSNSAQEIFQRIAERLKAQPKLSDEWVVLLEEFESLAPEIVGAVARTALVAKHARATDMLEYWGEIDRPGALAWLDGAPKDMLTPVATPIAAVWVRKDANAFLDWIESLPDEKRGEFGYAMAYALFELAVDKAPERVLAIAQKIPPRPNYNFPDYHRIFRRWAAKDVEKAAAAALALTDLKARTAAVESVAKAWSMADPKTAFRWVQGLDDARLAATALQQYGEGLTSKDPKAAAEFAAGLPLTATNQRLMDFVILSWTRTKPNEALAWVNSMNEVEGRHRLLSKVVQVAAYQHPEVAAQVLSENFEHITMDNLVLRAVATGILDAKGPSGVQAFLEKAPEKKAEELLKELVPVWAARKATQFADWANGLPDSPLRAQTFREWSAFQAQRDLPGAIAWANALPNTPGNREPITIVAKGAFFGGAGGVKVLRRVFSPAEVSDIVEGWVHIMIESRMTGIPEWIDKSDALTVPAKDRLRERLNSR